MKKQKEEKKLYYTINEFRSKFLPEYSQGQIIQNPEEARALGAMMAMESISKIKIKSTK